METGYRIYDVMTINPITISGDSTVKESADFMTENDVGGLLVVKGDNLLGIITEEDLVRRVISEEKSYDTKVKEVMVTDIISSSPDEDIFIALKKMRDYKINYLPVLDDDGNLSGLVTLKDILKIEPQLFEVMADRIELREYKRKINSISNNEDAEVCKLCGSQSEELFEINGELICSECKKIYEK
ncbi:MAG: CBS domain-containing protein [Candidatus Woesearchaeota archaeon]